MGWLFTRNIEESNTQNHWGGMASFGAAFAVLTLTTVMAASAIAEPIDVGNTGRTRRTMGLASS